MARDALAVAHQAGDTRCLQTPRVCSRVGCRAYHYSWSVVVQSVQHETVETESRRMMETFNHVLVCWDVDWGLQGLSNNWWEMSSFKPVGNKRQAPTCHPASASLKPLPTSTVISWRLEVGWSIKNQVSLPTTAEPDRSYHTGVRLCFYVCSARQPPARTAATTYVFPSLLAIFPLFPLLTEFPILRTISMAKPGCVELDLMAIFPVLFF